MEEEKMIVMKFGGTSVGNAGAIRRVCTIIQSRLPQNPVVVTSAVGGVTNKLVKLAKMAGEGQKKQALQFMQEIHSLHQAIAGELGIIDDQEFIEVLHQIEITLHQSLERIFNHGALTDELYDGVISIGELYTANMLPVVLQKMEMPSTFADARKMLRTDDHFSSARPLISESKLLVKNELVPIVKRGIIPVTQGFVGGTAKGQTTTLGRGGSDFSATLIGAMLEVEIVEIWSDVDGVLTADPSLVPEAHRIRYMSYSEAAELAYFGAKVLHPATLAPAVENDMTVKVFNSMNPDFDGTAISQHQPDGRKIDGRVKSIAYKEGLTVITVSSSRMLMAYGFMSQLFSIFDKYETSVDLVTTSEVTVSLTIDNTKNISQIMEELSTFAVAKVENKKAIVCLVGEGLKRTKGVPGQIFGLLQDTHIYLISQGASEINLSFVIDEADLPKVIVRLHDYFFSGELDASIFC